jgi:hypothetical protein
MSLQIVQHYCLQCDTMVCIPLPTVWHSSMPRHCLWCVIICVRRHCLERGRKRLFVWNSFAKNLLFKLVTILSYFYQFHRSIDASPRLTWHVRVHALFVCWPRARFLGRICVVFNMDIVLQGDRSNHQRFLESHVVPELDLGIRYKGILESGHGGVGTTSSSRSCICIF